MKYNDAINASLSDLTDELAAAGWDSTQQTWLEALTAVIALIAETNPNSLPESYHAGYAAAENGDDRCPYAEDSYEWDAWHFGNTMRMS